MVKEQERKIPEVSHSAIMSTSQIPDPEKPDRMPKYGVGMVVYFFDYAGHTDDLVSYPCIGKGMIVDIRGRYHYEQPGIYYTIESYYIQIEEANIFTDAEEAIKALNKCYESEDGDYPHGWYV